MLKFLVEPLKIIQILVQWLSQLILTSLLALPVFATPVVVIDPGHGGAMAGVTGCQQLNESSMTLEVAKMMQKLAPGKGLRAEMRLTRDNELNISWAQRVSFANQSSANLFVSLHVEVAPNKISRGIRLYTFKGESSLTERSFLSGDKTKVLPTVEMVSQRHRAESERLALVLAKEFSSRFASSTYQQVELSTGAFAPLLGVDAPAVMIGLGFFSNPEECQQLADAAYRAKLAETIVLGMKNFFSTQSR
jgi:N-acetylmuramoyl-L-alanine amidase